MPETMSYVAAVNAALKRALAERPEVIVYGEDIGDPGGVFGQTKGLRTEFGARVFDTPISESAILGSAIGAAMFHMRPVVEIMWSDFVLVALDQLVNQAANVRYINQGRIGAPITVRMQQGMVPGSCAQHSQCLEAIFGHIPGIRVCLPSTPQDAYNLLLAAIWSDDPVVVIEQRRLYATKGLVSTEGDVWPIGGAEVRRSGTDVTVITWSGMLHPVLEAADVLASEGISAEVIDLRWLDPLDIATAAASVARTSKVAIVHEANVTGGFGAEVAARITSEVFHDLDAPPLRIGLPDLRVPAAPGLQAAVFPDVQSIAAELRRLVNS